MKPTHEMCVCVAWFISRNEFHWNGIALLPLYLIASKQINLLLTFHLLHIIGCWFVGLVLQFKLLIWLLYRWIAAKMFGPLKIQPFLHRSQHIWMRMMWKSNPNRYVRRTHASIIQVNAYWHAADAGECSTSVNHMNCLYHFDMGVIFSIWFCSSRFVFCFFFSSFMFFFSPSAICSWNWSGSARTLRWLWEGLLHQWFVYRECGMECSTKCIDQVKQLGGAVAHFACDSDGKA